MGSLSHIGPRFGNAPATVQRPVAKVTVPLKAPVPAKPVTSSLLPAGWALRDYLYYGLTGVGAFFTARTFGPSIGTLGSMLLGSKPPPVLPPPTLSPASQIYAKFTSALDYIKPWVKGTAAIGGAGIGAMMLGPSAFLRTGERVASHDGGNVTLIETPERKIFTRKIQAHKRKIRLPNGTVIGSRPRKVTGRLATTPIESPPTPSPSTSRIDSSGRTYITPQTSPTSISSPSTSSEQDRGRSFLIQSESARRERPSSLPPGTSHSARLSETQQNRRGSLSQGLSGHLTNLLDRFSLPQPQEAPFRQTETPGSLVANEAKNSTIAPSRSFSTGSSINIENNTATTEPLPMVDFLNNLDDNQSSASNSLQNQHVEHSVGSSRQENQELLNQQPVPSTISENSEPLPISDHSLITNSNSAKGKEKEVKQVKTPESPPYLQWDSTKLPFPPEDLFKKLEETGLSNSINGESSSSTSSSASTSRANTGPIKMFQFWDDVDGTTTVMPAKNSSGFRSPFIVSTRPSGYATPQGKISGMSSPTSSRDVTLQNERGRSVSSTPSTSTYATPRDLSPVRETENPEQSSQDNVVSSSQVSNRPIETEKSEPLTSSSSENLEDKSSTIQPGNQIQSGSSSPQVDNTVETSSSTTIEKGKAPERNNPPVNHDHELLSYKLSPSRNPENLWRIIEKGISQEAATRTLHRICNDPDVNSSVALEMEMLLRAGAKPETSDLTSLLNKGISMLRAVELISKAEIDPRAIDDRGRMAIETLLEWYSVISRNKNKAEQDRFSNLLNLLEARWDKLDREDAKKDYSLEHRQLMSNKREQYRQRRTKLELSNYVKLPMKDRDPENLKRIMTYAPSVEALTDTLRRLCNQNMRDLNNNDYALDSEVETLLKAGAKADEKKMDGLRRTPLLDLLTNGTVDLQAVKLLLEVGADPRRTDYKNRNAVEITSIWRPSIITGPNRELVTSPCFGQPTILKNLLMTYADWHNALDAKDPQKLRDILDKNPDFKIPLAGDPTSSMAERLLFNPENSERIAQVFGQETPDFVKRVLNVPLDVDGFSKWARETLHPPLSLRVVNQPELITGLQYCLGKTREETEAFIQKSIEKEFHQDFEKVRSNTLEQFAPERQRLVELSTQHETPNGSQVSVQDLLAHEMAAKAAQRVMDDIRQPNNAIE